MKGRERLTQALADCGAVLKRSKKHLVYGLPNGRSLTVAATPSDDRAEDNALADLRHALGVEPRVAVVNPPRERRHKPGRVEPDAIRWNPVPTSPLAAALTKHGVAAGAELEKARETERGLRWRVLELETALATERGKVAAFEGLFVVRVFRAWQRWKSPVRDVRVRCDGSDGSKRA